MMCRKRYIRETFSGGTEKNAGAKKAAVM